MMKPDKMLIVATTVVLLTACQTFFPTPPSTPAPSTEPTHPSYAPAGTTLKESAIQDPDGVLRALPNDTWLGSGPGVDIRFKTKFWCNGGTIAPEQGDVWEGPFGKIRLFKLDDYLQFDPGGGISYGGGYAPDPTFSERKNSTLTAFYGENHTVVGVNCKDGWWLYLLPIIGE